MSEPLEELVKKTDSLTYLNALKVTLTQLKSEVQTQDELINHLSESRERAKRLVKKFDGQYRLFARLVSKEPPYASNVTVDETIPNQFADLQEVMESE